MPIGRVAWGCLSIQVGNFFCVFIVLLLVLKVNLLYLSNRLHPTFFCMKRKLVLFVLICLIFFCHGVIGPLGAVKDNVRLLRRRSFDDQLDQIKRCRTSHVIGVFGHVVRRLGGRHLHLHRRGRFLSLVVGTSPVKIVVASLSSRLSRLGPVTLGVLNIHFRSIRKGGVGSISSPLTKRLTDLPENRAMAIHLGSSGVCQYVRSSFVSHKFRRPFFLVRDLASRIVGTRGGTCRGMVHVVTRRIGGAATKVASALSAMRRTLAARRNVRSVYSIVHIYVRHYFSVDHFVAHFTSMIGVPRPACSLIGLGSLIFTYGHFVRKVYGSHRVALHVRVSRDLPSMGLSDSLFRRILIGVVGGTTRDVTPRKGDVIPRSRDPRPGKRVVVHALSPTAVRIVSGNEKVDGRARTGLFDPFFSAGPGNRKVKLVFVHRILVHRKYAFSLHACSSKLAGFHVLFPWV